MNIEAMFIKPVIFQAAYLDSKISLISNLWSSQTFSVFEQLHTHFSQFEFLDLATRCLWIIVYPEHVLRHCIKISKFRFEHIV